MLWLRSASKIALKVVVVFHMGREHVVAVVTTIFFENPTQKLLHDLNNAPLATKIERFLKGPKFSRLHQGSPTQAPSPFNLLWGDA